jgi:hypothetical protein
VESRALSESDREALAWAWDRFGSLSQFDLAEYTHNYPEWKRHEAALAAGRETRVPMVYGDFLKDPEPGVEPCHSLTDEARDAVAAGVQERFDAERLLG